MGWGRKVMKVERKEEKKNKRDEDGRKRKVGQNEIWLEEETDVMDN